MLKNLTARLFLGHQVSRPHLNLYATNETYLNTPVQPLRQKYLMKNVAIQVTSPTKFMHLQTRY